MLIINTVDAEIIKDGTAYLVSDNELTGTSLEVLSFMASGIKKRSNNDYSDGRPGRINYGAEDEYRTIRLTIEANAEYMQRVAHLRDSINELFDGEYYIREKRIKEVNIEYESPGQKTGELKLDEPEYVNGKEIHVAHVGSIEPDDTLLTFQFTVELETTELPYFESIYTTLELHDSGYEAAVGKYGLVDNIDVDKVQYRFTENNFTVYNAGNVTVEPESMLLNIQANAVTSSNNFTIRNKSTGEEIILKRESVGSHFRIQGMVISLGSITNIFRDTNYRFIRLVPGDNEFEILNGTFEEIRFEFKYYYK